MEGAAAFSGSVLHILGDGIKQCVFRVRSLKVFLLLKISG